MSNQRGFCSYCGAQVAAGASFCEACGKPVAQVAGSPTPPLPPAQIIAPPPGAASARMVWVIGGCATVGVALAILVALASYGYVMSQQGNVSQAQGTITRTVMTFVPLPIATPPLPAVTTSIAVVPLATPSLTQPAAALSGSHISSRRLCRRCVTAFARVNPSALLRATLGVVCHNLDFRNI